MNKATASFRYYDTCDLYFIRKWSDCGQWAETIEHDPCKYTITVDARPQAVERAVMEIEAWGEIVQGVRQAPFEDDDLVVEIVVGKVPGAPSLLQ